MLRRLDARTLGRPDARTLGPSLPQIASPPADTSGGRVGGCDDEGEGTNEHESAYADGSDGKHLDGYEDGGVDAGECE